MIARLLVAAAALAASSASARELTIGLRNPADRTVVERIYVKPFAAAAAIPVQIGEWDGATESLRGRKEAGGSLDLVIVPADTLLGGCDDGSFEKLDWSAIGGKDHYLPAGVSDCGVGFAVVSTVLAWDRDKFPGTPTWADFWDVAKYPGKRGLQKGPRTNLEIALLADGVAPGDVYRLLRSPDGIERAFRKLDQIRPYAVWWDTAADAVRILGSGEVLMTSAGSGPIALANRSEHRNFGMQATNSLSAVESWAVLKGTPNLRQAHQFLYFVGDSAVQARLSSIIPYSGLAKGASDGLPPEVAAALPLSPANQASTLPIDEAFWRDNADKLGQRFSAWLAR